MTSNYVLNPPIRRKPSSRRPHRSITTKRPVVGEVQAMNYARRLLKGQNAVLRKVIRYSIRLGFRLAGRTGRT